MGVPFEALIPGVIIVALGAVTGGSLSTLRAYKNGWKKGRHSVDQWDRYVKTLNATSLLDVKEWDG
ncbi:MAG: hypothetical protein Q9224_006165 [Gallowayella concinna]